MFTDEEIGLVSSPGLSDADIGLAPQGSAVQTSNATPGGFEGFARKASETIPRLLMTGGIDPMQVLEQAGTTVMNTPAMVNYWIDSLAHKVGLKQDPAQYIPLAVPGQPIVPSPAPIPPEMTDHPALQGIVNSLTRQATEMTTPGNSALAVGTMGVGSVDKVGMEVLGKILASYFAPEMVKAGAETAGEKSVQYDQAAQAGDVSRFSAGNVGTDVADVGGPLALAGMLAKGGMHEAKVEKAPVEVNDVFHRLSAGDRDLMAGRVPPERQLAAPKPEPPVTKFVTSPAGETLDISQLSPMEQAELMRGPREYVSPEAQRQARVRPAQQPPVVIGEQTMGRGLVKEEPKPFNPLVFPDFEVAPKEPEGGKVSFASPAEAKAVPSARQSGVPPVETATPEVNPDFAEYKRLVQELKDQPATPEGFAKKSEIAKRIEEVKNRQPKKGFAPEETKPPVKKGGMGYRLTERAARRQRLEGGSIDTSIVKEIVDYGKGIITKGMDKAAWADKVLTELGDDARPYLDEAWRVVGVANAEKERQGGQSVFASSGPRIAMSESGFKDSGKQVDAKQLSGRLQNILKQRSPTEHKIYDDAGVWKQIEAKGKISPEEAAKVMQENGPRVEVRKFSNENINRIKTRREQINQRMNEIRHELETLGVRADYAEDGQLKLSNEQSFQLPAERKAQGKQLVIESNRLRNEWNSVSDDAPRHVQDVPHWSSIAPKSEKDMPGYVEIAVVKPRKLKIGYDKLPKDALNKINKDVSTEQAQFPSSHNFPPNTLGFVRGYMETTPKGEKVFHVIEVQSDWAQRYRNEAEQFPTYHVWQHPTDGKWEVHSDDRHREVSLVEGPFDTKEQAQKAVDNQNKRHLADPLLLHYERLALKAAIDHAREQGATKIAISDAETAMMTEGHDRAWLQDNEMTPEERAGTKQVELTQAPGMRLHYDPNYQLVDAKGESLTSKTFPTAEDAHTYAQKQLRLKPASKYPADYKGVRDRADYDVVKGSLHQIAEELTGSKGERGEFGEHKKAVNEGNFANDDMRLRQARGVSPEAEAEVKRQIQERSRYRKDLIFRNADSTPKTSVSARVYDISKYDSSKPASLLEKDKTTPEKPAPRIQYLFSGAGPHPDDLAKFYKAVGTALEEGKNFLKGASDKVVPALNYDQKNPLPDLQPKEIANKVFSQPFASEKVPVLGRMMGGKARIRTPQDEAVATWYAERHGVAPAVASSTGELIRGKVKEAFTVTKDGDMNVKPTKAGQSLKQSDVFEALRKDPTAYGLSEIQKKVFNEIIEPLSKRMTELAQKYDIIDEMVDESGDFRPYFPRIVTEHPKVEELKGAGLGKQRAFSTEAEGWKRGYKYEIDPEKRLVTGIERLYRAMANQRLATDPVLGAKSLEQVKADLKEYYAEELGSGEYTQKKIDRIAEGIRTQGLVNQPILIKQIYDRKTAKMLSREFAAEQSSVRNSIASANSMLKALELGFDLGVGQIQMLPMLYNNPPVWAKAQLRSFEAMVSPNSFAKYIRKNKDVVREMAQLGSSVGKLSEFMSGSGKGEVLSNIFRKPAEFIEGSSPNLAQKVVGGVVKSPAVLAEAFGRQFQSAMDVAKIEMWKAWRDVTPKAEWPKVIQSIESTLLSARMESGMVPSGRSLLERVFTLAPSYYRGAVNLIAAMGESGVSGKIARRAMGRFMLGGTISYVAIAKVLGMKDDEIEKRLNPQRTDFMMWQVKQGDNLVNIGYGGIYRSMTRLAANTIKTSREHPENWKSLAPDKNPLTRWYKGHAGPSVSLTWEAFTGKDFLGRDSDIPTLGQRVLPLMAQQAFTPEGETKATPVEYAASFAGLTTFPESYSSKRTRMLAVESQNQFQKPFDSLSFTQRRSVQKVIDQKMKEGPKGMSATRQREIAMRMEDERKDSLLKTLSPENTKFLQEHSLQISGYKNSKMVGGVSVGLTKEEGETLAGFMSEEYNKALDRVRSNPDFASLSPHRRDASFSHALETARVRAWNRMRAVVGKSASQKPE